MFQNHKVAYLRRHVKVRQARPFPFLREGVAYILAESARKVPHASLITQFDVTPLIEYTTASSKSLRAEGKLDADSLLKVAVRKTYSAFFIKTIAHALHNVPAVCGFLDYAPMTRGGTFYETEDINLAFTVHTSAGVVTPIARNAHKKTLETVAQEMRVLARKARRTDPHEIYQKCARAYVRSAIRELDISALPLGWVWLKSKLFPRTKVESRFADVPEEEKLQADDIIGSNVTIANVGMVVPGIQGVALVIQPSVMFMGIGDLHLGPAVVDGKVVPRYLMSFNCTIDHRAFDGGDAFPLQPHLERYFSHPELIYEWKEGDEI
jgi:pyruvate/2-oxoglutarate dehydrogenase complex dihydrolipoamide acyltransferase (E2) component